MVAFVRALNVPGAHGVGCCAPSEQDGGQIRCAKKKKAKAKPAAIGGAREEQEQNASNPASGSSGSEPSERAPAQGNESACTNPNEACALAMEFGSPRAGGAALAAPRGRPLAERLVFFLGVY